MKQLAVTVVLCLCAVGARADVVVIPFSDSGTSGTIAPGESWSVDDFGTFSWGSPGVGEGVLPWPGPPTPQDITDFTITFTGLPTGVTIDPTSLATPAQDCAGNANGGTVFCSSFPSLFTQWIPTLSNGNDTITWEAPAGISLNGGDNYFANIFFTGAVSSVTFTGGWSSPTPVPEPGSLLFVAAGLCAVVLRRRLSSGLI
jgi:hypothetical protein